MVLICRDFSTYSSKRNTRSSSSEVSRLSHLYNRWAQCRSADFCELQEVTQDTIEQVCLLPVWRVSRAPDHLNAAAPQRPVAQRAQIIETNKWFRLTMYYTKRFGRHDDSRNHHPGNSLAEPA